MSLRLPASDSPVRDLIDVSVLAELGDSEKVRQLPTFRQAITNGRRWLSENSAARELHSLALRGDGELWLVRVGRRGGWSRAWNFGRVA